MAKKPKRPSWFKLWLNQKPLIDAVPDDVAGRALKAAYHYFDTREVPELDSLAGAVFAVLKSQIDEAISNYNVSVEAGTAGANKRWGKESQNSDSPPIASLSHPIGENTEDRSKKIEDNISCAFAVQLLNDLSGSRFRDTTKSTQKLIHAREKEGYTREDFETVIRHQCKLWGQDTKMQKYLRPETLFGSKFDAYLSDARRREPKHDTGYKLAPVEDPWETAVKEGMYV
jgi:uncharacterized phage protein (TIGR02220 family)